ncbi:hypothetical protein PMAYCL1PPCAC_12806, partial [Pristionchus mayeri]
KMIYLNQLRGHMNPDRVLPVLPGCRLCRQCNRGFGPPPLPHRLHPIRLAVPPWDLLPSHPPPP